MLPGLRTPMHFVGEPGVPPPIYVGTHETIGTELSDYSRPNDVRQAIAGDVAIVGVDERTPNPGTTTQYPQASSGWTALYETLGTDYGGNVRFKYWSRIVQASNETVTITNPGMTYECQLGIVVASFRVVSATTVTRVAGGTTLGASLQTGTFSKHANAKMYYALVHENLYPKSPSFSPPAPTGWTLVRICPWYNAAQYMALPDAVSGAAITWTGLDPEPSYPYRMSVQIFEVR